MSDDPNFWVDDADFYDPYALAGQYDGVTGVIAHFNKQPAYLEKNNKSTELVNAMLSHYVAALMYVADTIPGEKNESALKSAKEFAGQAITYAISAKEKGGHPVLINRVIRLGTKVLRKVAEQRGRNGDEAKISDNIIDFLKSEPISPFVPWDDLEPIM